MGIPYTSKALKKKDRRANKSVNRELIPLRRGDSERFVRIKKGGGSRAEARCRKKEEKRARARARARYRDAGESGFKVISTSEKKERVAGVMERRNKKERRSKNSINLEAA